MDKQVVVPLLFSKQEVHDRFLLQQFINRLFIPCKAPKGNLYGLNADDLFTIFTCQHPSNVLTRDIVHQVLLYGGYVDVENAGLSVLYATIKEEAFFNLSREAQLKLLKSIKEPLSINYRQIILGMKVRDASNKEKIAVNATYGIQTFLSLHTLNAKNASSFIAQFNTNYRCDVTALYEYYVLFTTIYHIPKVNKQTFFSFVSEQGFEIIKGRVYGKAGTRFFPKVFIPLTVEDRLLSVEMNMCCISFEGKHFTPKGILETFLEAECETIKAANLKGLGFNEQERTQIETEKSNNDYRRTFEGGAIPICTTTPAAQTKDNLGHNGRNGDKSKEVKNKGTKVATTKQSRRTIDIAEGTINAVKAQEPKITTEDIKSEFVDEQSTNGKDVIDDDRPSIEQIATALAIPYSFTPKGGFTKECMQKWLNDMQIPDIVDVMEHYEELMEILQNKGGIEDASNN